MKIARFIEIEANIYYGVIQGDEIAAIKAEPWLNMDYTGERWPLDEVKLLSPVRPPDVIAIGLNYKGHADETGFEYPSAPVIFLKASSSVVGPGGDIVLPAMAPDEVDYEAELVIVIGQPCRNVSQEEALDYVLGYTCGNDVSARDCQLRHDSQWARGKSFDTFCPLGPWIETDMDPDNADISLRLNGEIMQQSNTNDLIFSCAELVSYCSQVATLRPGTVIVSGTPSGVGFTRQPPVFLRPGDKVEVIISGIGVLENNVVEG